MRFMRFAFLAAEDLELDTTFDCLLARTLGSNSSSSMASASSSASESTA
jgi:hypothetical protein